MRKINLRLCLDEVVWPIHLGFEIPNPMFAKNEKISNDPKRIVDSRYISIQIYMYCVHRCKIFICTYMYICITVSLPTYINLYIFTYMCICNM